MIKHLIIITSFVIGGVGGFFLSKEITPSKSYNSGCQSNYLYINQRIGCRAEPTIEKHEYTQTARGLNNYISEVVGSGNASHVSVYFRDMLHGPTFGISEKEKFAPASLLKVPLMITYLNMAEKNPQLLSQGISYSGEAFVLEQTASSSSVLEKDKPYTIEELLFNTITESDNLSYALLVNALQEISPGENLLSETMTDLGLVNPRQPTEDTITVKSYGSLFRHLYNSSYLTPEMSEKALELLSQSSYTQGLTAGVPDGTKVAHKFGERAGLPNDQKQLHDCGIIYYPDNPYLLCVMTRGDDYAKLADVISSISEKVYKEVDSRKIK